MPRGKKYVELDECPSCGHTFRSHDYLFGCMYDESDGADGIVRCICNLRIVGWPAS
jgi:hypothetical protein